ncbi:MAG: hypothetical protein IPK35_04700 [Saprospiraceae bacterium]|jgi:hypothetical protein|nr:hypothetical protein [Saprospiraceae bacterium]
MKNKLISLLTLRFRQVFRLLSTVGWGLGLVFLFVGIGIFFPALNNILGFDSLYSVIFTGVLIFSLDYIRKDKLFLMSIFPNRRHVQLFVMIEYFILTLPILIFQGFIGHYTLIFFIISTCILIGIISPAIKPKTTGSNKIALHFIKVKYFEFKFHVESGGVLWIIIWLLGFVSYFHIGFYIFWIFVISMMLPEMFRPYESREMLYWRQDFLQDKVLSYIFLFLLFVGLQTLTTLIFHFDTIWIILYCIICLMTAILMNISIKYAGYTPIHSSGFGQNTSGLLTMLMILPGGVLITMVYCMIKYFRAKYNLQSLYA